MKKMYSFNSSRLSTLLIPTTTEVKDTGSLHDISVLVPCQEKGCFRFNSLEKHFHNSSTWVAFSEKCLKWKFTTRDYKAGARLAPHPVLLPPWYLSAYNSVHGRLRVRSLVTSYQRRNERCLSGNECLGISVFLKVCIKGICLPGYILKDMFLLKVLTVKCLLVPSVCNCRILFIFFFTLSLHLFCIGIILV